MPVDQWPHVAATFDGNAIALYIDGQSRATCNSTATFTTDTTGLSVGAASGTSKMIDGLFATLDEIALYRRALAPREVRALASGESPAP